MPAATWTILTPPRSPGAIGIVQIRTGTHADDGADLTRLLRGLGLDVPPGRPTLRDLLGVDRGVVIRWNSTTADLFPHGGPAVIRRLTAALTEAGVEPLAEPGVVYPEAGGEIEARMLTALARAASPLAVDLLLDQPRRWAEHEGGGGGAGLADARVLRRLIDPPLVAAVGPSNVGKSTLLNALAGRSVAVVADAPGTTRDHVGAVLDLGGLVVRYLDTPGMLDAPSPIDLAARRLAERAVREADLLLLCGDPGSPFPGGLFPEGEQGPDAIRVCLRRDLGEPTWRADAEVSAIQGAGVGLLAGMIRERLVPGAVLADPRPWRFWGEAWV